MDHVYIVFDEDAADDPAWGIDPIFSGSPTEVRAWLGQQQGLGALSVVRSDGEALWAEAYLTRD